MADSNARAGIILTATDRASGVLGKAFAGAERKAKALENVSKTFSDMGNSSLIAGGAITAFFGKTIQDARESEMSQAKLIQGFKTMGGSAKLAQDAMDFAGKKEFEWGIEDEKIMDVQGKLSTYARTFSAAALKVDVFNRATTTAFDMQAKGFGDAMGNINALGIALQNPALRAAKLSKTGAINAEDIPGIKLIQKTKGIAAAQDYLLQKLEKQFQGTAAKMADPIAQMRIQFTETSESIGKTLLPNVKNLADKVKVWGKQIADYVDKNKNFIISIAKAGVGLLAFGAAMKGVGFVLSGFSTAFKIAGGIVNAGQFTAGLFGAGRAAVAAGGNINKFQAIGLKANKVMGVVSKGVVSAFRFIGMGLAQAGKFLLANPIILIITAIAVAALLIYKYWDKISAFFSKLWQGAKAIFSRFWIWAKGMFLNYTPYGLIIKHWSKISGMFVNVWNNVKGVFNSAWQWIKNLGSMFYDAGKNIVSSIWNGIKNLAHKPVEAIKNMVAKMRRFLPFSPAKEGPLKDIHRIKLVETIAQSLSARPLLDAWKGVTGKLFGQMNEPGHAHSSAGANNAGSYSFSATINVYGGTGKDVTQNMKEELDTWWKQKQREIQRISF